MPTKSSMTGRWIAGAAFALGIWLTAQVGMALAAAPDSQIVAQALPTPTPFRFLTPTPFAPGASTTSPSTSTTTTAPRAGGFPMELAFPVLAGGLAAIGGGALVFRRKGAR